MDESDLRRVVRKAFGKNVEWVEPNVRSSVSVGVPDCRLKIGEEKFEVELKVGKLMKGAFKLDMRPPQVRYHIMGAKKGKKTAIMFAVPFVGSENEFMVYVIPGHACPRDKYVESFPWQVATSIVLPNDFKFSLKTILGSADFWKSK